MVPEFKAIVPAEGVASKDSPLTLSWIKSEPLIWVSELTSKNRELAVTARTLEFWVKSWASRIGGGSRDFSGFKKATVFRARLLKGESRLAWSNNCLATTIKTRLAITAEEITSFVMTDEIIDPVLRSWDKVSAESCLAMIESLIFIGDIV